MLFPGSYNNTHIIQDVQSVTMGSQCLHVFEWSLYVWLLTAHLFSTRCTDTELFIFTTQVLHTQVLNLALRMCSNPSPLSMSNDACLNYSCQTNFSLSPIWKERMEINSFEFRKLDRNANKDGLMQTGPVIGGDGRKSLRKWRRQIGRLKRREKLKRAWQRGIEIWGATVSYQ